MDLSETKPKKSARPQCYGHCQTKLCFAAVGWPAPNVTLPDLDEHMINFLISGQPNPYALLES